MGSVFAGQQNQMGGLEEAALRTTEGGVQRETMISQLLLAWGCGWGGVGWVAGQAGEREGGKGKREREKKRKTPTGQTGVKDFLLLQNPEQLFQLIFSSSLLGEWQF